MCPAKVAGLYALKPTVGLVPGKGVISISHVYDPVNALTWLRSAAIDKIVSVQLASPHGTLRRFLKP